MIKNILLVGIGGFIGAILRYITGLFMSKLIIFSSIPYSTLAVNLLGSFILGIVLGLVERTNVINNTLLLFLAVGICGSFTTFSTFSNELYSLLISKNWIHLFIYTFVSIFFGIALIFGGRQLIKIFI